MHKRAIVFFVFGVFACFVSLPSLARADLYAPGATLDPACAPTDNNCGIATVVASSTANSIPYYAANGSLLSATSSLTILQNGNIGIGTASPSSTLSVVGTSYFGSGFSSNGTLVAAAPYATVTSGSANFGPTSGETSLEFVGVGHIYRIRQNGTVTQMKIYIPVTTGITGFYLKIWRQNGTTFNLVGSSNNLAGSLTAGQVNTLPLSAGITVAEGDYIGARVEYSSASVQNFFASTAVNTTGTNEVGAITYSVTNSMPSSIAYNWASQTAATSSIVLEEVDMAAPIFVTIGDSITSGLPANGSFSDNYTTLTDITVPYAYRLGHTLNYTYQNAGVGSNRTNQMLARFTTDVVNKRPKFVVIMGGVNDIHDGTSNSTIVANFTSMLNAALAAGITPVIVGVLPFRTCWFGSNSLLQQRDLLNASLRTIVTSSPYNGYYVNPDSYVGQYYSGGDTNNLWTLRPQYDSGDGLHPSAAGQARIAQAISDALGQTTTQSSATLGNLNILGDTTYTGDAAKLLQVDRNPQYETAGSAFTISAGGASTASTNQNGGNLILQSGVSTGSGASALIFQTSGGGSSGSTDAVFSTRMTILGNGNVGIGTTTPGVKLQVTNGSSGYTWTPNVRTASIIEGNNTNGTALTIVGPSTGNSAIFFATPSSEGIDSIAYDHPSESLRLVVHSLERLRITSAGLVGIGTTTPYASLEVWGPDSGATTTAFRVVNNASTTAFAVYDNGNATYSGSIFQSSDQRLKTDITLLDASSSLVAIEGLTPVSYTRIDQPGSGTNLGFLAQSVQQIFPELVSTTSPTALTPDGTLTLNYVGLIAPMVKAFQALATEVNGFAQSITTAVLNATTINSQQDNTQKLCLSDSSGSTCYTRSQLNALLPVAHCTIQYGTNLSAFPPDATSTSLSSNTDAPPPDAPTASSSPNSTSSPSAATDTGNAASASTTDSTATTASP